MLSSTWLDNKDLSKALPGTRSAGLGKQSIPAMPKKPCFDFCQGQLCFHYFLSPYYLFVTTYHTPTHFFFCNFHRNSNEASVRERIKLTLPKLSISKEKNITFLSITSTSQQKSLLFYPKKSPLENSDTLENKSVSDIVRWNFPLKSSEIPIFRI